MNPFFSMTGKEASINLYLFDGETTHTYLVEDTERLLGELVSIPVSGEKPILWIRAFFRAMVSGFLSMGKNHYIEVDQKGMVNEDGKFYGHGTNIAGLMKKYEFKE